MFESIPNLSIVFTTTIEVIILVSEAICLGFNALRENTTCEVLLS